MEEKYLEETLRDSVKQLVSVNIQNEIDEKVEKFREDLESSKDQFIAEVMKGIRIIHERNMEGINYKITFENIYKIEK